MHDYFVDLEVMANKEISNVQEDITEEHTLNEKQLDSRKDKGWAWVIVAGHLQVPWQIIFIQKKR